MSSVMSIGIHEIPEIDPKIEPLEEGLREQTSQDLPAEVRTFRPSANWNPESFAREQIRGLVRQIFFCKADSPARQVVFSPIDADIDVRRICRRVGEALALETAASIAIAGEYPKVCQAKALPELSVEKTATALRQTATRMTSNLWLIPFDRGGNDSFTSVSLRSHFGGLRREFQYSIVESASPGTSNEAVAMAQLSDGIVLVVAAHHTRRATARNVKERLEAANARILGVVLSDRAFPIPEAVYRRL